MEVGAGVQFDLVWSDARLEQLVGLCDVSAEEIPVRGGDPFVAQIGERGELSTLTAHDDDAAQGRFRPALMHRHHGGQDARKDILAAQGDEVRGVGEHDVKFVLAQRLGELA